MIADAHSANFVVCLRIMSYHGAERESWHYLGVQRLDVGFALSHSSSGNRMTMEIELQPGVEFVTIANSLPSSW